eukprot:c17930_g1_i4.p1 GENE.c17930_g1_i4~~c17930_g1_i4.p1  ORF type:complete len:585 (+),score=126.93 c17930_g1_i4:3-1757(+)
MGLSESGNKSLPALSESPMSLIAELELLKEVARLKCGLENAQLELCQHIELRIAHVKRQIENLPAPTKATEPLGRSGGAREPPPEPGISPERRAAQEQRDSPAHKLAVDTFLSNFGAVFDQTLHHLLCPASAVLRPQIPDKVAFNVYVISNHDTFEPDDPQNFHFTTFREELERLRLPHQDFSFKLHKILLEDDPAVAMAFYSSLRSGVVATLKVDGSFESSKRLFLDSMSLVQQLEFVSEESVHSHKHAEEDEEVSQLQSQLHRRLRLNKKANATLDDSKHHEAGMLQVPIFLFSLGGDMPVFIDKYFQARAVRDVVVAVQSSTMRWDSHMSCNEQHIKWNLRNPLRAVVMATAQIVSGLLPSHVYQSPVYNRLAQVSNVERIAVESSGLSNLLLRGLCGVVVDMAHGLSFSQNWLWSVGQSPLSFTSSGTRFSELQIDIARRNQIIGVLESGASQVSRAFQYLQAETPTARNFDAFDSIPGQSLLESLARIHVHFSQATQALERLDFETAVRSANAGNAEAYMFYDLSLAAVGMLEMMRCDHLSVPTQPIGPFFIALPVIATLIALLLTGLQKRGPPRPKIN